MSDVQRHHVNWTRRSWNREPDDAIRQLRTHSGLIVPAHPANHRLVHLTLDPTPFPTHTLAQNLLEEIGRPSEVTDRMRTFTHAAHFLIDEAEHSRDLLYSYTAKQLGEHYFVQLSCLVMEEELAVAALRNTSRRAA